MNLRILSVLLLAICAFATSSTAQINAYPIYEIQGDGAASPLEGTVVTTEGMVTGWYPDMAGFFVQDTLGDQDMLTAYHKARYADVQLRVRGIDLLNRASQASSVSARNARAFGLNALYALAPVRKLLMQMGLGVR